MENGRSYAYHELFWDDKRRDDDAGYNETEGEYPKRMKELRPLSSG